MNYKFFLFPIVAVLVLCILAFILRQLPIFKINTNRTAIIKEIKELNKLETAQFSIEKVIDAQTNTNNVFQDFLFGDKILLIADGQVVAGFDLSKLQKNDVSIKGSDLSIKLPAPEILYSKIDNEKTKVYDRRLGLLTKGNKDLESEARKAAESSIRQAACDANILEQASTNVRKQLKAMFSIHGFSHISIDIPKGNCK
jgi:hypothetical protein